MIGLALRSLRHRAPAFTATFLSVLAGTALIGSFATLFETSLGPVSKEDQEILFIMGAVVGAWGSLIVLFSLASTLGIAVGQRDTEIATLRTIGATPGQARRMIRTETLLVALVASTLGAGIAWVGGRGLLAMIREAGMVSDSVAFAGGPLALGSTVALVTVTSVLAATIAGRRATSGPARLAMVDAASGAGRMRWWRILAAVVLVGYGVVMAMITVFITADSDDPYAAMQTAGSSSILVGVGLAVLAPTLLRWTAVTLRPLVGRFGVAGHLAAFNTSRRAHVLGGVLAPVIVFTAASVGTLTLVAIDGRTSGPANAEADLINLLNNVVVGMISLFAAIMVINAFAAVIAHRRNELARVRLLGATGEQVRSSVLVEAGIIAAVGVLLGLVAASATVVPFALARDEGFVPDGTLWLPPVLVALAVVLTLAAAALAVRRATAAPVLATVNQ
ncbi:FtsX-like permease family protein [Nocardioides sp. AE5]|uniref:ABC transporter permease n=1 Tax=Nocardioides sp. AE5 TaxID=2962573 RepID=UPI0028825988|nr:FtsX-like permease family protein [Nocardioides sp. AE5]MDT0202281.1 FtsX-like permease family protein [Nocardioides sp. AE5]